MGLVDPRVSRVDNHEHLGREIGALAVEQNARNLHLIDLVGVLLAKKMERGQPVLAIDDEKLSFRLTQKADTLAGIRPPKAQGLVGKYQNGSRDQWLAHGRFVEVDDLADLSSVKQPLEGFFALFDSGDKPRDLVVSRFVGLDAFPLEIVAA